MIRRAALFVTALMLVLPAGAHARIIHRERSLYRNIVVTEEGSIRCLLFSVRRDSHDQSCIDLRHPKRLVFAYVRMTMAGLLLDPHPRRILVIGLGGGSIPMTLSALYPRARVDVVELDPAVARVAHRYFGFAQTPRMTLTISDGRVYVKRAALLGKSWDLVVLDAFNGDYIPEHLMTVEFLKEVKSVLTPQGVVVANTFATSALYDYESQTYKAVYGKFFNFRLPDTGNRIIIASNDALPDDGTLAQRAEALASRLAPYGVPIESFAPHLSRQEHWDHSKPPLTDQFSPANLLRGQQRN